MDSEAKLNPPFRAEHIGSLLRPTELTEAFKSYASHELADDDFRRIQDRCIIDAIKLEESVGLNSITDGEFRRSSWAYGFVAAIDGFVDRASPFRFYDAEGNAYRFETCYAARKLRRRHGIATGEFDFVRQHTSRTPKITIPSPSFMHFFQGTYCADPSAYKNVDEFWEELLRIYEVEIAQLGQTGATYLQIDEVAQAMLCDQRIREQTHGFGEDPERLVDKYIGAVNRILRARPQGMTVGMHLCRGNFRSRWLAAGSYEAVAERLFTQAAVDGFFLEYDTERAGDFAPLRFMPRDKMVVLGLVSTKIPALENKDYLKRRIDEASRYMPLERLAISPQCGFASTVGGNLLSLEDEAQKLRLVVEVAEEVWG